jgi:dihydrolipoamide dehydrogenase
MPSKALLHAAGIHALGADYPWPRASDRRDYINNREGRDLPDDTGHVTSLRDDGAEVVRGDAQIVGPGLVRVRLGDGSARQLRARFVVVAVGTGPSVPDLPGLDGIEAWTNREATSTRTLPKSVVILGGGPTGVEMGQVFARYGVPVSLVHSKDRLNDRDHERSSEALAAALARDGVELRLGQRAEQFEAGAGRGGAHLVRLSGGSVVEGHEVMLAIGRTAPLDGLGLDSIGVTLSDGRVQADECLRIAQDTYVIGDVAGPEMHTHLAHYQGEMVVRIALGDDVRPDFSAIPRATYTDPETAGVGLRLEDAKERGLDAFEKTADLATSAKGYVSESEGHVSIVIDRSRRTLTGAFIAGPGASEAIHLAVLAVKTATPIEVLADTITAFPTTARVMGGLFMEASRDLGALRAR